MVQDEEAASLALVKQLVAQDRLAEEAAQRPAKRSKVSSEILA
jgi:hypothetical protein